ncbi:hypothetical protein D9M73_162050 [compost metagenome]
MDYAARLAQASPAAIQISKRLMKAPHLDSTLAIIREENLNFIARLQSPECRDALENFVNRRR